MFNVRLTKQTYQGNVTSFGHRFNMLIVKGPISGSALVCPFPISGVRYVSENLPSCHTYSNIFAHTQVRIVKLFLFF